MLFCVWNGIKAAGQFIADTVVQVIIDTMVTLITAALRGLLMTADVLLGSSFSYSESQGIFTVPIGGINLRIGLSSLQGGIAITFGNAVISIRDLFRNPDLTTETLGLEIFDVQLIKSYTFTSLLLSASSLLSGGLIRAKRHDAAFKILTVGMIANVVINVFRLNSFIQDLPTDNREEGQEILKLLFISEILQVVQLVSLFTPKTASNAYKLAIFFVLLNAFDSYLNLLDSTWSDASSFGLLLGSLQVLSVLIAKGASPEEGLVITGKNLLAEGDLKRNTKTGWFEPISGGNSVANQMNDHYYRSLYGNDLLGFLLIYHMFMAFIYFDGFTQLA
ncbi:MAG: hypothetical protein D6732_20985 [Methanobacteriota archaeon]|nr:MAG: hypothetical protein D6732_20985 [Euryarchaeota archaeon]